MDFVQALQRRRPMRPNSYEFDNPNGFSYAKPSWTVNVHSERGPNEFSRTRPSGGIVDVRSPDQWKTYLDATRQNDKLLVVEFTARWCGPCRYMEQPMKDFAAKYSDVQFIRIDVDELWFVAKQFDVSIMPAFILVKKGKEVDRVAGVKKNELQYKIEKHRA
ncbi:hypothetical protein Tsubulata_035093 [Turnera subulata]|uniref:Thioredoxin domain-containing protein n=1 Tax=Turnera subulata TaxID=218843 RepID=A0A9Q0FG23_9ROSI|nr:hypothetical protein Tsubulata_035093 [Turnera subulata]